jgi:hypothetical protein
VLVKELEFVKLCETVASVADPDKVTDSSLLALRVVLKLQENDRLCDGDDVSLRE